MFIYETLLAIGGLGIIVMTLMGFAHIGGSHHAGHSAGGHAGHAHGGGHHAVGGHTGHTATSHAGHHAGAHAAGHHTHASASPVSMGRALLALFSPMTLFAAC